MLHHIIIRLFIIISFFFFGYNLTYIIILKKKQKNNNPNQEVNNKLQNTSIPAKVGIHLINNFILLCCLNIFIYNYWINIFPRINLYFLSDLVQVIDFTLIIGGNISLLLAYRKLGIYWAYPIDGMKRKTKLVKNGIYGKIRHPIYLSFNIFCICFNMVLLDWFLLIINIIGAIGLYIQAISIWYNSFIFTRESHNLFTVGKKSK